MRKPAKPPLGEAQWRAFAKVDPVWAAKLDWARFVALTREVHPQITEEQIRHLLNMPPNIDLKKGEEK
jgi:hypothetical protein